MIKYFWILVLLALFSCQDQNMTFDIGSKYVDVRTTIRYVDTLTVKSYTVKLDSIRTSALNERSITAGKYHDPEIGDVSATSFFRVGLPSNKVLPTDAVYDSILLVMVDDNFFMGDTMNTFTLQVHRLMQTLKARDDGFLYNTSSFHFDPALFGSVSYTPRPGTDDTLNIRLDDSFGQELFDLFMTKDEKIQTLDNFLNYFKGLVVTFNESDNAIQGFKAAEALPEMKLFYHYSDVTSVSRFLSFPINSSNFLQFNRFNIDNPVVEFPENQKDKLYAPLTDNKTYVQGGTGIATRFEIPYLRNLLELHENMQVLRAELVLEPVRNTYKLFKLPERISLYITDRLNRIGSPMRDEISGEILTGNLVIDNLYQEETSYTFDVTSFIMQEISIGRDNVPALLLTISPEDQNKYPSRLILGSQLRKDNTVKLKIYYMSY